MLLRRSAGGDGQFEDVILAIRSDSLAAARQASQTIPIVALDLESDPVASGVAQSLSRPGGNVSGIFFDALEIAGKWIQIMREVLPQIGRVALRYDSHLDQTQFKVGESTARKAGIETLRLSIDQPSDFRGAFQRAVDVKMDAMLVHSSPIFVDQVAVIAELAREFRLPSIGLFPICAEVGFRVAQAGWWHRRQNPSWRKAGRVSDTETDLSVVSNQYAHRQIAAG